MNKLVSIVIPIYKSHPSKCELYSFRQCYTILKNYDKYIVTFKELDISEYQSVITEILKIRYFNKEYFASINGYNTLLKEYFFYKTFAKYDYMLIYQLDAWVFKDTLTEWCKKGYDYVGAPWFANNGSYEKGDKLSIVGNGGLSLRRIEKFLNVTNPRTHYKSITEVFKTEYRGIRTLPVCILRCLGYRNTVAYFRNFWRLKDEDVYFIVILSRFKHLRMRCPTAKEAVFFSFETSPRYLFELTNHILPFGCHAWEKFDKEFYKELGCPS